MFTRFARSLAPAATLAATAFAMTGCTADRHTFSSTPMAPKSVDITYIQSGETAWSYDIPAGQKLTLEFTRPGQFSGFKVPNTPAEGMKWYISDRGAGNDISGHPGKFGAQDSGEIELTGEPVQINLRLRDADVPDETPAPIEVVPPPPVVEELEEEVDAVPPPPAMEEMPAVEEPVMEEPMMEEAADDALDSAEEAADAMMMEAEEAATDAVEATEEAVEEAADEMTK
ncbi:MAG: hypothetical protein AAGH92_09840 [Planctomycetota bacterium]